MSEWTAKEVRDEQAYILSCDSLLRDDGKTDAEVIGGMLDHYADILEARERNVDEEAILRAEIARLKAAEVADGENLRTATSWAIELQREVKQLRARVAELLETMRQKHPRAY